MEILIKKEQTARNLARDDFNLWCKIEFDEGEQAIVKRYHIDESVLIEVVRPDLIRKAIFIAVGVVLIVTVYFYSLAGLGMALTIGCLSGCIAVYWYIDERREKIFVRDLIHGWNFTCYSVAEIARKETWLETITSYLGQVIESAKHWDGNQRPTIKHLVKDEASKVILKGL